MKKLIIAALLLAAQQSNANILRVNNTPGIQANYSTIASAITAASAGDTIYLEGSQTNYGTITLNKRLTITGPGYFLNDSIPNPHTQVNKYSALVDYVNCNVGSKGSVVEGLEISLYAMVNDSLVTIQRNNIPGTLYIGNTSAVLGDTIRNNYLQRILGNGNFKVKDLLVYNNIFASSNPITFNSGAINISNGYCINNSFIYNFPAFFTCANFIFQNNIFHQPSFGSYLSSNSFINNVAANTGIPIGNNNIQNASSAAIYLGWTSGAGYSSDGRYRLAPSSQAINAGTLNGMNVDCGAFGGPAPYVLSGMPSIPSIYLLTVPQQIVAGSTTMSVTVSAAAH